MGDYEMTLNLEGTFIIAECISKKLSFVQSKTIRLFFFCQ